MPFGTNLDTYLIKQIIRLYPFVTFVLESMKDFYHLVFGYFAHTEFVEEFMEGVDYLLVCLDEGCFYC